MVPLTEEEGSLGVGTPVVRAALTLPLCPDQLQEELERKVQAWEQECKGAFLVKGQQFMDYVSEQWQLYRLEKEKEKQERVSAELSLLASAWEHPWLLPKNASLGVSLLIPSHRPGLCLLIPSLGVAGSGAGAHCCHICMGQAPFWPQLCQR